MRLHGREETCGQRREMGRTSRLELTSEDSERSLISGVAKDDASTGSESERGYLGSRYVEGDGHREEHAVRETEGLNDAATPSPLSARCACARVGTGYARLVVLFDHEAAEGTEASVQDELEVAELSLGETDGREVVGLVEERVVQVEVAQVEVHEDGAMGSVGHAVGGAEVREGEESTKSSAQNDTFVIQPSPKSLTRVGFP